MKTNKLLLILACVTGCLCLVNCNKTPGQKLDHALNSANEKAKDAKEAVKKDVKEVRKDIADKVKP